MAYLFIKVIQCLGDIRFSSVIVIYLYHYVILLHAYTRGDGNSVMAHWLKWHLRDMKCAQTPGNGKLEVHRTFV